MRSMNVALWPAGWGYFLSNMMGVDGTGLTSEAIAWAREHFVRHVRSAGPYPTLRCGRQPYGVLPVTSLDLWKPRGGEEAALAHDIWLKGILQNLRDNVWRPHLGEVARLGRRQPADPDADLADVMRTDAQSSSYSARTVFGRHYLQHLRAFLGEDLQTSGFIAAQDAIATGVLQRLGLPFRPRIARAIFAEPSWRVSSPLVQTGEVSPWRKLEPDYIGGLLAEPNIDAVIAARPDAGAASSSSSLLQMLLRHALLREVAQATASIAASAPGDDLALLRDAELVDLVTGATPTLTWKRQLDLKIPVITGDRTIREFLESLTSFDAPAVTVARRIPCKPRPSAAARQRVVAAADAGHARPLVAPARRLDHVVRDQAPRMRCARRMRKASTRAATAGWKTCSPRPPLPPPRSRRLPANRLRCSRCPTTRGFIHAPSMTHAAAAALLRNAHLGAAGTPQPDGPFAIDMSSRRVREAARLLDGVRQGQPLGALLGYRFERSLHELSLDRFIAPLRDLAPLVAGRLEQKTQPLEAIAANNVVDGQSLHGKWRDDQASVIARLQQAGAGTAELATLKLELNALGDAIDGLSDALTAEVAYQLARGNTSRIASTLAAVAHGDAPAPELEVARMPRSGIALTHRVLVMFSGAPAATPGWADTATSARASAEPMLNAWAAKLLGDPGKVRCTIDRLDERTGASIETRVVRLSELQLTPLDVVYGVEAASGPRQASTSPSEVEQRLLFFAQRMANPFAPGATLRIQHARPADLAAGELTLLDVVEQARAVRQLLSSARGADAEDLNLPERAVAGALDIVELQARVANAEQALSDAQLSLDTLVKNGAAGAVEPLRSAVLKLGTFGIGPGVPLVASGDDASSRAALLQQAVALLKDGQARLDRGSALRAAPAAGEQRVQRDQLIERMKTVFGTGFVALPRFSCDSAGAAELNAALASSAQTQGGDAFAAHTWLARSARVREPVARLAACLRCAEVLGTGERANPRVAQLPFVNGERWVALPSDPGKDPPAGKLSLVLQTMAALDASQPLAGLWVDEWIDVVPSRRETTAITFQFNPPDACAPQSVLLAVPPAPEEAWTVASLHRVLVETLDLAKLRAVDAELLTNASQYLPALYFAFNAKDDAVSTDFAALTR